MSLSLVEVVIQTRNLLADNQNFVTTIPGQLSPGAWDETQFIDAVNFAVKDFLRKKKGSYTVVKLPPQGDWSGTPLPYDFVNIPSDYLGVERMYWNKDATPITNGSMLFESDRTEEEWRNPDWEAQTATAPNRWLKWDSNLIRLVPIALSDGSPPLNCSIGYLQTPVPLTSEVPIIIDDIVVGKTYSVISEGTPADAWEDVGALSSDPGTLFVATGTSTGTGTALEMIDRRVNDAQQEYLKYSAAYYLLMMRGDRFEVELAEKYMLTFNQLIGVA
jgi:hypothetical protein